MLPDPAAIAGALAYIAETDAAMKFAQCCGCLTMFNNPAH
jgi:hypothetical protein